MPVLALLQLSECPLAAVRVPSHFAGFQHYQHPLESSSPPSLPPRRDTAVLTEPPRAAPHHKHRSPSALKLLLTSEVCFCHSSLRMGAESSAERMAR